VVGWEATLDLLPVVAFGLIYPGWVAFHAAEVRDVGDLRTQLATIVGAKVISIGFALVLLPLPLKHLGEELFGSSVYLALADPASFWQLAPRLFGLPNVPWLGPIILICLAVAVNTWFWTWIPNHALAASRVMLAMSWDRLLPRWLSHLHPRFGTPVNAVLVFSCVCSVAVLLYAFRGVWRLAIHGTLVNLMAFTVTCAAAALFPFLRRELYRESTAGPFEVFRIPVITVAALAFVAFSAFLLTRYLAFSGSLGLESWETILTIASMCGVSLALHLLFRRYRHRHEGADLEIVYREATADSRSQ
jgi:amino acid transporter